MKCTTCCKVRRRRRRQRGTGLIGNIATAVEMGIDAGKQAKIERRVRRAYRKKHRAVGGRFWNMGEGRGSMYGRF